MEGEREREREKERERELLSINTERGNILQSANFPISAFICSSSPRHVTLPSFPFMLRMTKRNADGGRNRGGRRVNGVGAGPNPERGHNWNIF